jgi:methylmalonyl-CoA/ethylmalonyl-CoA epimerase
MKVNKIEHIAIAVRDLENSVKLFENLLGVKCYAIEEVEDQKVRTAFFRVGETKIELLEATSEESTIAKFVANKGEGLHHIAFQVENIEKSLSELSDKNFRLIDTQPRKGAEGLQIAFLHPKSVNGVLVELCSEPSDKKQEEKN